jgi:hypothetical protein
VTDKTDVGNRSSATRNPQRPPRGRFRSDFGRLDDAPAIKRVDPTTGPSNGQPSPGT